MIYYNHSNTLVLIIFTHKLKRVNINFINNLNSIVAVMLKFKEIKRAIIHPNEHNASPILLSKKCFENNHQISFKTIKQFQECSPLPKKQLNQAFNHKFDTDKKNNPPTLSQFNIKSECKENNPKSLYYNRASDNSDKKLEFGHKKRKVANVQPSEYYQKSYQNSASKNTNISFANLLQSKRTENGSKNKNYLESDRKKDRQSSISKLKEKLFGMKRVISEKQPKEFPLNRCETERTMINKPFQEKNIFKGCHINIDDEDIVKVSIKKDEASIQELDMVPYF